MPQPLPQVATGRPDTFSDPAIPRESFAVHGRPGGRQVPVSIPGERLEDLLRRPYSRPVEVAAWRLRDSESSAHIVSNRQTSGRWRFERWATSRAGLG